MNRIKLELSPVIKRQILAITGGRVVPFFLRKKNSEPTLEMIFYTCAKYNAETRKKLNARVSVGYPKGLKVRKYYLLDSEMNAVKLSATGRGKEFTTVVK